MKQNVRDQKQVYINRDKKQIIIDTPIHTSITKQTLKDGTIKENVKHIANIPNEILIFMFEKFKLFSDDLDDVEYISAMLNGDDDYYLSFYNSPEKEHVEMQITNHRINKDDGVSVKIVQRLKTHSYVFTVSKKVFDKLDNNSVCDYKFRFVINLDCDSEYLKNFIVCVGLV